MVRAMGISVNRKECLTSNISSAYCRRLGTRRLVVAFTNFRRGSLCIRPNGCALPTSGLRTHGVCALIAHSLCKREASRNGASRLQRCHAAPLGSDIIMERPGVNFRCGVAHAMGAPAGANSVRDTQGRGGGGENEPKSDVRREITNPISTKSARIVAINGRVLCLWDVVDI